MIKRLLLTLVLLLTVTSCNLDGINGIDDYLGGQLVHSQVTDVVCPDTVQVGLDFDCTALNRFHASVEDARWSTSDPLIAEIGNLSGDGSALSVGTVIIVGMGWRTQAADTITVR